MFALAKELNMLLENRLTMKLPKLLISETSPGSVPSLNWKPMPGWNTSATSMPMSVAMTVVTT